MIDLAWLLPISLLTVRGLRDRTLVIAIAYASLVYLASACNAGARELRAG